MERNVESDGAGERAEETEGFPWYVKAALAAVVLVVLFVVGIDLAGMLGV